MLFAFSLRAVFEIRSPQLSSLSDAPLVSFAGRVHTFLFQEHRWLLSDAPQDEHVRRIADAVQVGLRWGIDTEWDLCRFVVIELQAGPTLGRIDGPSWALDILRQDDDTGAGKADALEHYYYDVLGEGPQREAE